MNVILFLFLSEEVCLGSDFIPAYHGIPAMEIPFNAFAVGEDHNYIVA